MTAPGRGKAVLVALIVLVIGGVVATGTLGGGALRATETPEEAVRIGADLDRLHAAADRYVQRTGRLPESLDALVPADIDAVPLDPYGRAYVLRSAGPDQAYIWCLGADGALKRYPPDFAAVVTLGR